MASEKIQTLTVSNFEQVVGSPNPVLVDFWAEWCGPCRMIAPVIEDLATTFDGRAVMAKLNVDEHPTVAEKFNVRSIPTLLLFKQGELVESVVGVQPRETLKQLIEKHA
ncbi:MAG: thioredoxin [Luteitalea sp.]|nr:thioredoxin [Luteitalea sp.]